MDFSQSDYDEKLVGYLLDWICYQTQTGSMIFRHITGRKQESYQTDTPESCPYMQAQALRIK